MKLSTLYCKEVYGFIIIIMQTTNCKIKTVDGLNQNANSINENVLYFSSIKLKI